MRACAMQMATTSSTSTLASVSMMRGTPANTLKMNMMRNAPGAPPVYNNYPYGSKRYHEGPFRQFNGQFPQGEFPPYAAGKMMEQPSGPMMMDGPGKMMGGNYPQQYGAGKMMGDFGGKMMGDNMPHHNRGFPGENFNNMHQGNFRDSYHQPTFGGNRRYQGEQYRPQYDSNYQGGFGGQRHNFGGGKHSQYPVSRQQYW